MTRRPFKLIGVLILILLPFGVHSVYQHYVAFPKKTAIATGPAGGRYRQVGDRLAETIQSELGVNVRTIETNGSLENFRLLTEGRVQFCIYQHGTQQVFQRFVGQQRGEHHRRDHVVAFVSNLYSEVAHFIVRRGSSIRTPDDLKGKRVAVGMQNSGDYAMSLILLDHFGLGLESIQPKQLQYPQVKQAFVDQTIDAAFITVGVEAPILRELFATGQCDLISIPFAEALAKKHIAISQETIPAGLFNSHQRVEPPVDVQTVSLRAQLLTRTDVSENLVEEVTRILHDEQFLKENHLAELFINETRFSREKPEFAIHPGALNFYEPDLQPLLDTDFVEATEGIRSFVVSVLIAAFLIYRWWKNHRIRANEHQLDRYIRSLLDIERRQLALDEVADSADPINDIRFLQTLLDEVTSLRQEALKDFSAHELAEDRA
ncbi:MAG: TAXI family TRAP transporter solute-binding subunit, partial [Dehalococcoidia bacterium]